MSKEQYYNNRRRIRANKHVRELAAAVTLSHREFIQPLFVDENVSQQTPIETLHEINSDSVDSVLKQIESDLKKGISKFLIFPVPAKKSEKDFDYGFTLSVFKRIKESFGDSVWLAADVCLCAYTSHGHCGILNEKRNRVLNHQTVETLADYSLQLVQAGADCIAPSDMMDGRIGAIRSILDKNQLDDTSIMSYSAKFSSQFYGPFRDACKSAPGKDVILQDRKTYQSSPFNSNDAILSTFRDIEEGADIVMVKPALPYLDIIQRLSQTVQIPIAAYHVSGEYQSIELLVEKNIIERGRAHTEIWTSLKRGGAGIIISYASRHAQEWINEINY
jgi:porphobilinogen synthase